MLIPLNVLLYQLAANSIFETQNINLGTSFDGIKLYDAADVSEGACHPLYLISADTLKQNTEEYLRHQRVTSCSFLCTCPNEEVRTSDFHRELSLILLYTRDSFPVVFNNILNIFRDFDIWDKNFHLMLLQQKSLQELLDLSRNILVHPMVVLDRNYSLLGYLKSPETSDPIMEGILEAGYVTPQIMTHLRQDGLISISETTENPLINWYCLTSHDCYYSMMYRFTANSHTVGYALIFRCVMHPKTNYLNLMNMVSDNLQLYFQQERFASRSSSEIYESILTEILDHPDTSSKKFADQISYISGLEMNGRFLLARISYTDQAELPYSFICWNLRNSIPQLKPFIYRNVLYILRNNSFSERYDEFLSPREEAIFRKCFRGHIFTCSISNVFFSLMDLPLAVSQCTETLQLRAALGTEDASFYRFEDISILYMLRELKKNVPIKMIVSPCYTILKQYDAEHNSDLCDIFMHFLKNGRNINQTSAAIFLHRNTVLNKVKKAAAIMQNECEDYQTQIAFILSYLEDHTTA